MLGLSIWLLYFSLHVLANTEIINFSVSGAHDAEVAFANGWPCLNHTHNDREWDILPAPLGTPLRKVCEGEPPDASKSSQHTCLHELWVVLDLTRDWAAHSSFTLRLSWPASYPADFSIQIYNPDTLLARFGVKSQPRHVSSAYNTRHRYARIRAVDTGVRTPNPDSHETATKPSVPIPVPFILILEPLYFGFLPSSVLPVLGFIVLACVVSAVAVPKITKYLEGIAMQARKELDAAGKHE